MQVDPAGGLTVTTLKKWPLQSREKDSTYSTIQSTFLDVLHSFSLPHQNTKNVEYVDMLNFSRDSADAEWTPDFRESPLSLIQVTLAKS